MDASSPMTYQLSAFALEPVLSSRFSVLSCPRDLRMLPHHGCVLRLDLVHHAHFIGLSIRIFIDAMVFFGQLINVGVSAFFGDFDYSAADFEIAIRIIGINNRESYARIAANVAIFLTSFGGVENDVLAVEVAPYWGYLRAAVGHQCA